MHHEPRTTGTKVCKGPCGLEKHVLAFSVQPSCHDGLQPDCRECCSKARKTRPSAQKAVDRRIIQLRARFYGENGGLDINDI